jgi:HEAT repeat protein
MKNILDDLPADDRSAREADVRLLANAGIASYKALSTAVADQTVSADVRQAACWAIGKLGGARAVRILLGVLKRGEEMLTFEAAKSLIALEARDAIPQLVRIMKLGTAPHNRAAAAYVLGILGSAKAVGSLKDVLDGNDTPEVRSHAAEALGHIGDAKATDSVLRGLKDREARVRFWSAFALGEIGDRRALSALRDVALNDKAILPQFGSVSSEARKAIKRLKARTSEV